MNLQQLNSKGLSCILFLAKHHKEKSDEMGLHHNAITAYIIVMGCNVILLEYWIICLSTVNVL